MKIHCRGARKVSYRWRPCRLLLPFARHSDWRKEKVVRVMDAVGSRNSGLNFDLAWPGVRRGPCAETTYRYA